MIDHQDVRINRAFTRLQYKTAFDFRALATQAVIRVRSGVVPETVVFGDFGKFTYITAVAKLCPAGQGGEYRRHFATPETIFPAIFVQPIRTAVIAAPFQQRYLLRTDDSLAD